MRPYATGVWGLKQAEGHSRQADPVAEDAALGLVCDAFDLQRHELAVSLSY